MGLFIDYDAKTIHDEIIAYLQDACGEVLPEGDERRIFAEAITAYMLSVIADIDDVAKQKMLRYARGEVLDCLGEMYGCTRLPGVAASCTLRFSISEALGYDAAIPVGTVASTVDGYAFATDADASISAGSLYTDVAATAVDIGSEYNGFVAGSVTMLRSALAFAASVSNTDTTSGGTDGEPDDDEGNELYRQRILLLQNAVNTAGTESSYKAFAIAANESIADVQVPNLDEAYTVYVYVVKKGGQQFSSSEIEEIQAACDAPDVRPLGDLVEVRNAVRDEYQISVSYTCDVENESAIVDAIEGSGGAIDQYVEWQDETIARGIQPQKLMANMFAAGADTVTVTLPAAAAVIDGHVAKCTGRTVTHTAV